MLHIYIFHLTKPVPPHYLVKHRCYVPNCFITLEFITIILRVRHPSVERPPYSEEGTAAQVPKEDQELTAANKQVRMTRARQLLNQYPNLTVNFMFFASKSYSPLLPDQLTERSFLRPSEYQKEERQRKPTSSNEIDIQQVSRVYARPMDAGLAV